jgi:lysozyme
MRAERSASTGHTCMKMSKEWRGRLRRFEGKIHRYYDDGGSGRGNCGWGIGILAHYGPCSKDELRRPVNGMQIETAFASRLADAERIVQRNVTRRPLTQAQFDALVSFTYNVGEAGAKTSYQLVNAGNFDGAANKISSFIYVRVMRQAKHSKVIAHGLIQRRAEESAPFRSTK